ncbi:MAG: D-tyrosyl-tRNA(Tyr) deacylase [Phycisphaerales bacterium]|nr:D-tyrosyl-tRNA(Tyr) deacylase [Phycisphaerales bacterium]
MIAVVQRVSRASVSVEETGYRAEIGRGLVVLLGVEQGDERSHADWLAGRIARLRIFADDAGLMNRSVRDVGGQALVVSQFTLAGDCRKGNRPSFDRAAGPELAESLYEYFVKRLAEAEGVATATGVFRAMMAVELVNDGPVTLMISTADLPR